MQDHHTSDARERLLAGILKATEPPIYRPDLEPCWFWMAGNNGHGYGRTTFRGIDDYAHRVSYSVFVGPIPSGYDVDHLCFVTLCINPSHLEAVTRAVNNQRRHEAQRRGVPVGTLNTMIEDTRPEDDLTPPDDVIATTGEWLTVADAATRLHCSGRTVHRKITTGELPKRTLRGGRIRVWVSEALVQQIEQDDVDDMAETSSDIVDAGVAIIGQQRAMIAWLNEQAREQTAPLVQRIEELSRENGRLQAELDAERARQVPAVDVRDARPWWRKWWS